MVDGNTEDKKLLAQKEAEVEELKKELEKAQGRVDNAQAKIHEWEEEVGENRKATADGAKTIAGLGNEVLAANKKIEESKTALEQALKELAEAKKVTPGPKKDDEDTQLTEEEKKTADDIEAELTDDERKVAEAAWEKAPEELRKKLKSDADARKGFLLETKRAAAAGTEADLSSPWKTPAQKKSASDDKDEVKKLFKQTKESAENTPDGPGGGTPREGLRRMKGEPERHKAPWLTRE